MQEILLYIAIFIGVLYTLWIRNELGKQKILLDEAKTEARQARKRARLANQAKMLAEGQSRVALNASMIDKESIIYDRDGYERIWEKASEDRDIARRALKDSRAANADLQIYLDDANAATAEMQILLTLAKADAQEAKAEAKKIQEERIAELEEQSQAKPIYSETTATISSQEPSVHLQPWPTVRLPGSWPG